MLARPRTLLANPPRQRRYADRPLVPVVIVGGTVNSLGVVRSLSKARMPIFVLSASRQSPAGWSKYCRFVRAESLEGRALIDRLVSLASLLGARPVLILTSDRSVLTVSSHRNEIEPLYRISLPTAETVLKLADKALFDELAAREGFAVPRTASIASAAEITRLDELEPPLVIKPAQKPRSTPGIIERPVKVATRADARREASDMLTRVPGIVAQEWIEGPDHEIYFSLFSCDGRGHLLGMFTGRKLVSTPPTVGITALCVPAPEFAEELSMKTRQFIEKVRYRGLGSLEFKRDNRSGRFIIVEPTVGRTDWQEEIATLCGINLPLLTYWAELGLPFATSERPLESVGSRPIAWRSSLEYPLPPPALLARGTRVIDGHFRWSDPLPAAYYYLYERFALRLWRFGRRTLRFQSFVSVHTKTSPRA